MNTPSAIPEDAKHMAMFCHLIGLLGLVIPLGNLLGTAVLWQLKKDMHPFVDDQGKEATNFHLGVVIAGLICSALVVVVIGIPLLGLLYVFTLIFTIVGGIKANNGEQYRYPLMPRLLK